MSCGPELFRAARRFAALMLALGAGGAAAGAPLPSDDIVVLAVVLDGRPGDAVGRFVLRDGVPHASASQWRELGLRWTDAAEPAAPDELVSAAALTGVRLRIDPRTQSLAIDRPPEARHQVLGDALPAGEPDPAAPGAVLNYDLLLQRSAAGAPSARAGLFEARTFGPWGLLEQGALVAEGPVPRRVRLDTTYTHMDPARLRRVRAGDFVAGALSWTRPPRLAGLQAMTDFALRPDLVTAPMPAIAGQASLPSTVDLLVDGVRRLSQPVEPGSFEVRQVPVVSGLGEVALVVRDALGRETVQSLPFYAAARQLAPGLSSWSAQVGRVRRHYGVESADYGPWAAIGSWRAGLDARNTVEAHAEATEGAALAGLGVLHVLPGLAALEGHVAAARGGALQVGAGIERQTRGLSAALAWQTSGREFRDVAAAQGDAVPRRSLRASGGVQLGAAGSVGIAYAELRGGPGPLPGERRDTRLATASWSFMPIARVHAHLGAYRDVGAGGGHGVALQLTLPLGGGAYGGASWRRDGDAASLALQAGRPAMQPGELGWRVQREQAVAGETPTRQSAQVEHWGRYARLDAGVETLAGRSALRVGARGALVALGGALLAAPPVLGSVALVEVPGMPGVAVYRENRHAGRTDAAGRLVLTDLLPWQPNRIAIEPLDLPAEAEPTQTALELRPRERSGARLRFAVARPQAALLELHDAQGRPLPIGARARLRGGAVATIGHDGQAWLRGLAAQDNEVEVSWRGRSLCTLRFGLDAARAGRVGPLRCG
ncbi:MAG TPA: fimbria/pilus outer membrane usher protein [Methylibium sp.]|nr:fimbria/pilus outer membrane usher protein [Methylibium sp.]